MVNITRQHELVIPGQSNASPNRVLSLNFAHIEWLFRVVMEIWKNYYNEFIKDGIEMLKSSTLTECPKQ